MEVAYRRGFEFSKLAHKELSPKARSSIAAAELSDVGVDTLLSRKFAATLAPPMEILEQYCEDEQTAFFAGWLDGAIGSSRFRESTEAAEQLSMDL